MSIVRDNLMRDPAYRPYTGCDHMFRAQFDGSQFFCVCGWKSEFEPEFISAWKVQHNRPLNFRDPINTPWRRH